MSLKYDNVFDRVILKNKLIRWKLVAFTSLFLSVLIPSIIAVSGSHSSDWRNKMLGNGDIIGRLTIEDVIDTDYARDEMLSKIKADKQVKALIIRINSPGGSAGASEALYRRLLSVGTEKPIVVVMGSVAASGGYLVALAGDYIVANATTLTGSIGVLMRFFNASELAKRVGVTPMEIKTSPYKAEPSPFADLTEEGRKYWMEVMGDTYDYFVSAIVSRRNLSKESVMRIANGRVYSGTQALNLGLIDAVGSEEDAIQWIKDNNVTLVNPVVKDIKIRKSNTIASFLQKELMSIAMRFFSSTSEKYHMEFMPMLLK